MHTLLVDKTIGYRRKMTSTSVHTKIPTNKETIANPSKLSTDHPSRFPQVQLWQNKTKDLWISSFLTYRVRTRSPDWRPPAGSSVRRRPAGAAAGRRGGGGRPPAPPAPSRQYRTDRRLRAVSPPGSIPGDRQTEVVMLLHTQTDRGGTWRHRGPCLSGCAAPGGSHAN